MAQQSALTHFVVRPDVGTSGQQCRVIANHFNLGSIPDIVIYQYAIEIGGMKVDRKIPFRIAKDIFASVEIQDKLGASKDTFIYDGATLGWSKNKIADFDIKIPRGRNDLTVSVKSSTSFSLGAIRQFYAKTSNSSTIVLQAMTFLSHLFAVGPALSLIPVGRKFFTPNASDINKFGIIEFRRGLFQAVHLSHQSLTVNIDVTTGVFWNSDCVTAIDLACRDLNVQTGHELSPQRLSTQQSHRLTRLLKGLKFRVRHRGETFAKRQHTISRVSPKSAREYKFKMNDESNRNITVEEYMKATYNYKLKYPTAVLAVKGDSTCIPLELCYIIPCQRFPRALDERQAQEMIKVASGRPSARKREIVDKKQLLQHDTDPMLKAYGIKVQPNMAEVKARRLILPQLSLGGNGNAGVSSGEWNGRHAVFKRGVTIRNWGILVFAGIQEMDRDLDAFVKTLTQTADDKGMRFMQRTPLRHHGDLGLSADQIAQRLHHEYMPFFNSRGGKINLLVVITPAKSCQQYAPIKRYCDTVAGIASQCVVKFNVRRKTQDRAFACNLLMKINAKLGGVNVSLRELPPMLKTGTVFLGADVSHPSPGAPPTRASLASMTGSIDALACRYAAVAANQTHRTETIADVETMATTLLSEYRKATTTIPQRIIYLRDGVAEGQYASIIQFELTAIRRAADKVTNGKPVKVTVIIVRKRHHTRFFPPTPQDGDRTGNVMPGTVVDSGITHPIEFDFFLVPHKAFQGTVRPAHYHVIHDDNKFRSDQLQTLLYHQSYVFARSSTSVSLRTPFPLVVDIDPAVYYAHLAGNRAKVRDESLDVDDGTATSASVDYRNMRLEDIPISRLRPMHAALNGGDLAMWYL